MVLCLLLHFHSQDDAAEWWQGERDGGVGQEVDGLCGVGQEVGGKCWALLDVEVAERMCRDVDGCIDGTVFEVGDYEHQLAGGTAQECELVVGVHVWIVVVGVHEVEHRAGGKCFVCACHVQQFAVVGVQGAFVGCEFSRGVFAAVAPATQGVDGPIVEDGGASVLSARPVSVLDIS